jgi:hypothetical protein
MRVRATVGSILADAVLSKTAPEGLANFQTGPQGSAKRAIPEAPRETLTKAEIR